MKIEGTIATYLTQELYVKPFYGCGWCSYPQKRDYMKNVPDEFKIRLLELCKKDQNVIGGIGIITTRNHEFFDYYFSFIPRYEGFYTIENQQVDYNVFVASKHEGYEIKDGFIILKKHEDFSTGFAYVYFK